MITDLKINEEQKKIYYEKGGAGRSTPFETPGTVGPRLRPVLTEELAQRSA